MRVARQSAAPRAGQLKGAHLWTAPNKATFIYKIVLLLGIYYLLGRKETKSDEFSEIGVSF